MRGACIAVVGFVFLDPLNSELPFRAYHWLLSASNEMKIMVHCFVF